MASTDSLTALKGSSEEVQSIMDDALTNYSFILTLAEAEEICNDLIWINALEYIQYMSQLGHVEKVPGTELKRTKTLKGKLFSPANLDVLNSGELSLSHSLTYDEFESDLEPWPAYKEAEYEYERDANCHETKQLHDDDNWVTHDSVTCLRHIELSPSLDNIFAPLETEPESMDLVEPDHPLPTCGCPGQCCLETSAIGNAEEIRVIDDHEGISITGSLVPGFFCRLGMCVDDKLARMKMKVSCRPRLSPELRIYGGARETIFGKAIKDNTRSLYFYTLIAVTSIISLFVVHQLVRLQRELARLNTYQAMFQRMWNEDRLREDEQRELDKQEMGRHKAEERKGQGVVAQNREMRRRIEALKMMDTGSRSRSNQAGRTGGTWAQGDYNEGPLSPRPMFTISEVDPLIKAMPISRDGTDSEHWQNWYAELTDREQLALDAYGLDTLRTYPRGAAGGFEAWYSGLDPRVQHVMEHYFRNHPEAFGGDESDGSDR
ncbi:hypothetical protein F5Y15DRAFT_424450 [Xylariaceae sp. FL0016]|nr:hypothetical protein F5Y15DRAFT_424450 [Xylariaceae sp. FL0016]